MNQRHRFTASWQPSWHLGKVRVELPEGLTSFLDRPISGSFNAEQISKTAPVIRSYFCIKLKGKEGFCSRVKAVSISSITESKRLHQTGKPFAIA